MTKPACTCAFHSRAWEDGPLVLPAPVLIVPNNREHSFWLWVVSKKPSLKAAAVILDTSQKPYLREFRTLFHAAKFTCQFFSLPVDDDELKTLCARGGIVRLSDPPVFLSDVNDIKETKIIPPDFGQSSLCNAWKPCSSRPMPPRVRKRVRLAPPPKSPLRGAAPSLTYDASELGGKKDEVDSLLGRFPSWDAEVVHELLHWGGSPKLVEVNHSSQDRNVTPVNCTFAQPDGRLVRNVILPLGVLKADYASQVAHL